MASSQRSWCRTWRQAVAAVPARPHAHLRLQHAATTLQCSRHLAIASFGVDPVPLSSSMLSFNQLSATQQGGGQAGKG